MRARRESLRQQPLRRSRPLVAREPDMGTGPCRRRARRRCARMAVGRGACRADGPWRGRRRMRRNASRSWRRAGAHCRRTLPAKWLPARWLEAQTPPSVSGKRCPCRSRPRAGCPRRIHPSARAAPDRWTTRPGPSRADASTVLRGSPPPGPGGDAGRRGLGPGASPGSRRRCCSGCRRSDRRRPVPRPLARRAGTACVTGAPRP